MNYALEALYQEIILDHNRQPHHWGELQNRTHEAEGYNPLCGDRVRVELLVEENKIKDIHFSGSGCALCIASASMMGDVIKGKTLCEAEEIFELFHQMVTQGKVSEEELGSLVAFAGVREFPIRIKCTTLAWHTLKEALANKKFKNPSGVENA